MISEKDILWWREHYKDLVREAEQERLAAQALAPRQRVRFNERVLAWLGRHFVAWGCYLQRRYAFAIVEGNMVASLDPAGVNPDCGCTT